MDIFRFRDEIVQDYADYTQSFIRIRDERISLAVQQSMEEGALWPKPLIQLNPSFEIGESIDQLVDADVLHAECRRIFRKDKDDPAYHGQGRALRLHRHQSEAVRVARSGHNYVLTTGTGSGKSLSYIIPIVNHVLRHGSGRGIQAIVVYPMNALANSQLGELRKFLTLGYPDGAGPVTFERYTGQESDEEKKRIMGHPPDILLTNYVMLELILTRPDERHTLVRAAQGLRFLVLDELHTYRGRQGADVAMLVRRVREALAADALQCIGTSATLAGAGSLNERRRQVAEVGSRLFGTVVTPQHVIGETLRRATPELDFSRPDVINMLRRRVADPNHRPPTAYVEFVNDPLSSWLEGVFGIMAEPGTGQLIRAQPRAVAGEEGAAGELSRLTGLPEDRCAAAIADGLLGGYRAEPNPDTGFPAFAFRLHQFISRGDTVFASLEDEDSRYSTVYGQRYVPGDRERVLLPLAFCRECGQEYFTVRMFRDQASNRRLFAPRELSDRLSDEGGEAGFLYFSSGDPWPSGTPEELERLPDEWIEEGRTGLRIKSDRRGYIQAVRVSPDSHEADEGLVMHYFPAPFRFCLHCGVAYGGRQQSDFAKLASLGSGGRSTATTILALSAVRGLRRDASLPEKARKLLSFTDNRQDASLQAGHFNDFVEFAVLRSALYRAARDAGPDGISHEQLTQRVFDALQLPVDIYSVDPTIRFQKKVETDKALRDVLGYRLYFDLRRGWRITSPNLEQCGLLEIRYVSLDELAHADDVWTECHPALAGAAPETRVKIAKVLLDYMRRELAIKVNYLDPLAQEGIQQQSNQRLIAPWSIDESERMEHATILFPRSSEHDDYGGNVYLSARGGFGQYLRRRTTFPALSSRLTVDQTETVIRQLLKALRVAGLVEEVIAARDANDVPGYQLPASAMVWMAGDGSRPFYDPIRVPREPESGGRTNPFFVQFYRTVAGDLNGLEAREHTAQVPPPTREEREARFREARLPVLFCSPTMELGVDISELNVVNMRNVPPTPANYAQRSGRAGRSGQPALVFTYCSAGSPHDQFFFRRPALMVAGAVTPPRLDLANEDLIRAHAHAIWLAETGQNLGTSLKDILDLADSSLSLPLVDSVHDSLHDVGAKVRARRRAERVLETIRRELEGSGWYTERWLDEALDQAPLRFDRACDRWRSLYRSAMKQRDAQHAIITDASRSAGDKSQAKRLRQEAESQLELLTEAENLAQSDFYSYRYFASEGFLPGYSFPRLPLSAYIPGRRQRTERDEFLSRPRFLAISEFGPRAIVYHEGSRYLINKVIMAIEEGRDFTTNQAKLCPVCGYLHPVSNGVGQDQCERCREPLDQPFRKLFRLQNVSTRRRDRISSDEEERLRLGYELRTAVRFNEHGGQPASQVAVVQQDGADLATLMYGHAATLWRINLGWTRRANKQQYGFLLDVERGYWARNDQNPEDAADDPLSPRTERVIPYVEDTRNCLLFEPLEPMDEIELASLQAALKTAIQLQFQLEDNELAAEPLPTSDNRRLLMFYESAEGGAGVLPRLIEDRTALASVARAALQLCHFDPQTGADLRQAPRAREECEAACYDCLMSYYNQSDHRLLDRQQIRDFLLSLARAEVSASPVAAPRADHLQELLNLCASELEREWVMFIDSQGYRLPSKAQALIESCRTRPDFLYEEAMAAIYVDGPHHEYPERARRDSGQTTCLDDLGYTVVRFGVKEDWGHLVAQYPGIFGQRS